MERVRGVGVGQRTGSRERHLLVLGGRRWVGGEKGGSSLFRFFKSGSAGEQVGACGRTVPMDSNATQKHTTQQKQSKAETAHKTGSLSLFPISFLSRILFVRTKAASIA